MKAKEILELYKEGKRDFRRKNIQGQSFKGENLSGADFSEADLRGTNFNDAILIETKFLGARAGQQLPWVVSLVIASWMVAAVSGLLLSVLCVGVGEWLTLNQPDKFWSGVVVLVLLTIFFRVTICNGLIVALQVLAGTGAVAVTVAWVVTAVLLVFGANWAKALPGSVAWAVAVAVVVAVTAAVFLSVAVASAWILTNNLWSGLAAWAVAVVVAITAVVTVNWAGATALVWAIAIALGGTILSVYTSWRALTGDKKQNLIQKIAIAFAATGGTSFCGADLTDADFKSATLKSSNFREATLTRTCWYQAKKLNHARVGDSILAQASVRDLLVSGNGRQKSYKGANLKGANLTGATLNEANLKEANISEATFFGAVLEGANLTLAQVVGTNFTNAHLTGACLEGWNIDSTTKLEQVDCRYVYLLERPTPETGNRERRPHNPDKVFEPGDFEKLYTKLMNTVQILLRDGINQEAFQIAFQKIMDENIEVSVNSIQAIEKKGNDVVLTVEVPDGTNKGQVERLFDEAYVAKLEAQKQAELTEVTNRHNIDIKEIALAAFKSLSPSSSIYFTNEVIAENKAMNDSIDASRRIQNRDGSVIGNIIGDSGTISGTVAETINQIPASPEPNKPGLKELLVQLQVAIDDPNLTEDDKTQALEQLKVLAEAGQNPKDETMQKRAKRSIGFLKVIAEGLPSAAKLVEVCNNVLPMLTSLLNLGS